MIILEKHSVNSSAPTVSGLGKYQFGDLTKIDNAIDGIVPSQPHYNFNLLGIAVNGTIFAT